MKKIYILDAILVLAAFALLGAIIYWGERGLAWLVMHWFHPGL